MWSTLLGISQGQTVSIVGCGGKTALLLRLGGEWREKRVLLSTTTKLGQRQISCCDHIYLTPAQWDAPSPAPGMHLAAAPFGSHKVTALPDTVLDALRARFALTLLECDGSRGLPLKGWRADEPVVPRYTDLTVGVCVVWPLGHVFDDSVVFQPERFEAISGAVPGEPLRPAHLSAAIRHPSGLFQHASGRKVLFFNQVEDDTALEAARGVLALLPPDFCRTLELVVAGSIQNNKQSILYRRNTIC